MNSVFLYISRFASCSATASALLAYKGLGDKYQARPCATEGERACRLAGPLVLKRGRRGTLLS